MTGGMSLQSGPWHLAAPRVLLSSSVKGDTSRESPTGSWSRPLPHQPSCVSFSLSTGWWLSIEQKEATGQKGGKEKRKKKAECSQVAEGRARECSLNGTCNFLTTLKSFPVKTFQNELLCYPNRKMTKSESQLWDVLGISGSCCLF